MKATGFVHQIESSSFLISFKILLECLTHLRCLTVKLHKQAIGVLYAYRQVSDVLCYLKDIREKAESTFSRISKETTLAELLHSEDFHCSNRD